MSTLGGHLLHRGVDLQRCPPLDGDLLLTNDGFLASVLGYSHPSGSYLAWLKYMQRDLRAQFREVEFEPYEWNSGENVYIRPIKPMESYQKVLESLQRMWPGYVHRFLDRGFLAIPRNRVISHIVPWDTPALLAAEERLDSLQKLALAVFEDLVAAGLSSNEIGIRGSISTGLQNPQSDIDLATKGAGNYLSVVQHFEGLVRSGDAIFDVKSRFDERRHNRVKLKVGTRVVVNATRTEPWLSWEEFMGRPSGPATIRARCVDDSGSVFRPVVIVIEPAAVRVPGTGTVEINEIWSLWGEHRGFAQVGDLIEANGTIEKSLRSDGSPYWKLLISTGRPEVSLRLVS